MSISYKDYLETAKSVKLSDNFTLYEVAKSDTAITKNISNIPNPQVITNASLLIKNILQPVRTYFKKPVDIHSFYRNLNVNSAVGSKNTSQHITGQACDFTITGINDLDIVTYIRQHLNFDQLILEEANGKHWVHVSFSASKNRKQVLKYNGRSYITF